MVVDGYNMDMPAPKDPVKRQEWLDNLRNANNKGWFKKGHDVWKHPNVKKSWVKPGQRLSKGTEFKRRLGYWVDKKGYVLVYSPKHVNKNSADGVYEHRLVVEKLLGRYLQKHEVVHHINENKQDNRITNLRLMDTKTHAQLHWNPVTKKFGKA